MNGPQASVLTRARAKLGRIASRSATGSAGLRLRAEHRRGGVPIPPGELIHAVANTENVPVVPRHAARSPPGASRTRSRGTASRWPLSAGSSTSAAGSAASCGTGPTCTGPEFHGTDYNPALVAWCRDHLTFATFGVNELDRPLSLRRRDVRLRLRALRLHAPRRASPDVLDGRAASRAQARRAGVHHGPRRVLSRSARRSRASRVPRRERGRALLEA